ncbi:MAG: nucleotidyltransferase domain-containing protein [Dehalococcoidia bacterium]
MTTSAFVDDIRAALPGVIAVYQFGSAGTPHERPGSDIDLAVLTGSPHPALPPVLLWDTAQRLAAHLGKDVDLVDLRSATTVMQAQVIANGVRLWCADHEACERFEDFVFSSYAHLNEERRGILEDISRRGSIHAG